MKTKCKRRGIGLKNLTVTHLFLLRYYTNSSLQFTLLGHDYGQKDIQNIIIFFLEFTFDEQAYFSTICEWKIICFKQTLPDASYVNTKSLPNSCLEEHGASRWRDVGPVLCPSIAGRAGGKETGLWTQAWLATWKDPFAFHGSPNICDFPLSFFITLISLSQWKQCGFLKETSVLMLSSWELITD